MQTEVQDYIKARRNQGVDDKIIHEELLQAGWEPTTLVQHFSTQSVTKKSNTRKQVLFGVLFLVLGLGFGQATLIISFLGVSLSSSSPGLPGPIILLLLALVGVAALALARLWYRVTHSQVPTTHWDITKGTVLRFFMMIAANILYFIGSSFVSSLHLQYIDREFDALDTCAQKYAAAVQNIHIEDTKIEGEKAIALDISMHNPEPSSIALEQNRVFESRSDISRDVFSMQWRKDLVTNAYPTVDGTAYGYREFPAGDVELHFTLVVEPNLLGSYTKEDIAPVVYFKANGPYKVPFVLSVLTEKCKEKYSIAPRIDYNASTNTFEAYEGYTGSKSNMPYMTKAYPWESFL